MSGFTTTATAFCAPSAAFAGWSQPQSAGASVIGALALPPATCGNGVAKHAHKRFTMAGTDIYGWPLGPRDWTSG